MKDQYIEQLHQLCNEYGNVDTGWLNCDATGVYFVTRTGTRLRVYETSPIEPPDVRRQTATQLAAPSVSPSIHAVLDQGAGMNEDVFAGVRKVIVDLPITILHWRFDYGSTYGSRRRGIGVVPRLV